MTIMQDTLAAELALLSQSVEFPTEPFGYGKDLRCITDVTSRLDEATELIALGESLLRQLSTERGSLPPEPDDPDTLDWGIDLLGYANRGVTRAGIRELEGVVLTELRKDDRVAELAVELTTDYTTIDVTIRVTPADPDLVAFTLIGSLTPDGAILRSLTPSPA